MQDSLVGLTKRVAVLCTTARVTSDETIVSYASEQAPGGERTR